MGNVQFINAGAGSGKTYTLTEKFCKCINDGARPSDFILTTYTKAAADEFRSKIKAKLMEKDMKDVIPLVESARIGTIHSVAQSYIEKYWYLLNMSPSLSIKEEADMKASVNRLLEFVSSEDDQTFFDGYCTRMGIMTSGGGPKQRDPLFWKPMVLDLVDKMRLYGFDQVKLKQFKQSSEELVKEIYPAYTLNLAEFEDAVQDIKAYYAAKKKEKPWNETIMPYAETRSWESQKNLIEFRFRDKVPQWIADGPQELYEIARRCALNGMRKDSLECLDRIFAIAEKLLDSIDKYKRAEGILEFSDLEILFLELLSFDAVKADIKDSVRYVFVDEFQDVSPIQLKIFQVLGDIVQDSCWVGDPKQAIYGFRGSDSSLVNSVIASMDEDKVTPLEHSHRSLPQLVYAANDIFIKAFAMLPGSESLKENMVKLEPYKTKIAEQESCGESYRGLHHWWVSVPIQGGESSDSGKHAAVYPAMAAKLLEIFRDGTMDLKYGDVAILTRVNSHCITIADALRAKGLPVSVLDDRLANQAEVRLLIALMKYVSGIDENLSLAQLRKLMNDENIETIIQDLAKQNAGGSLAELMKALRERYQYHSVYDMAKELIAVLDLRHHVCKWSVGQKRQSNLDVLVSMAASFVARKKDASVLEFIDYISDRKVEMPFDNTGDTIKVLSYHKSKGLQWKMVLLDTLYDDELAEGTFFTKSFSGLSIRTSSDGNVDFNLLPPVSIVKKIVIERIGKTDKALDLWDFLREKKRAEELRLFYVGFTRAEKYVVRLSFGAVPHKWMNNINVHFNPDLPVDTICDDSTYKPSAADAVSSLPYDKVVTRPEGKKKYIVPSQCEADPSAALPECELIKGIAGQVDIAGLGDRATLFGTCVHDYMAVHRWPSDDTLHQKNLLNAERVIAGYGFADLIDAEKLVAQADDFFRYVEEKYGKVKTVMHEVPFSHRKNGQVISGEIDLYIKTETGLSVLVDYKNPAMDANVADSTIKTNALKYWPQLDAYSKALCAAEYPVDHVMIFYLMLGVAAKFNRQF